MLWVWFFILGCQERKSEIELLAERCMPILIQIDKKQQLRHEKMDRQQELTDLRKQNKVSEEQFSQRLSLWMEEEQKIRQEVNKMFSLAEKQGCL